MALLGAFCLGDFFSMAVVGGLSYGFGCKALGELGDPLLRQSTAPSMKGWKIISLRRPRKLKRAHKDLAGKDHIKAIVLLSFSHPFPLLTFFLFMGPNNLINYKCKTGFF